MSARTSSLALISFPATIIDIMDSYSSWLQIAQSHNGSLQQHEPFHAEVRERLKINSIEGRIITEHILCKRKKLPPISVSKVLTPCFKTFRKKSTKKSELFGSENSYCVWVHEAKWRAMQLKNRRLVLKFPAMDITISSLLCVLLDLIGDWLGDIY